MVTPTQQAIDYITTCCQSVGAFSGTNEVHCFLKKVSSEMATSQTSVVFPGRYIEYVAYAVDKVASNPFKSPPAAVASLYLVTRFEFYFRVISGKLNADGTWKSTQVRTETVAATNDKNLDNSRISRIADAYKIMKLNKSSNLVSHCIQLDKSLYSTPITVAGGVKINNIADRIKFGRNAAGHGQWADISAEALFYGLMTAVVFYNQT